MYSPGKRAAALFSYLILLLLIPNLAYSETLDDEALKGDVRVLIDVSGSMKKNDPENLRAPALRLLVGLMGEDTRAGVWTFGQYVNMLIPWSDVDGQWKEKARDASQEIHSKALFTNIEEALKRSSRDWTKPKEGTDRHLILLTDGIVDVDKDPTVSELSRQRILDELLPRLNNADAKIHTISLSNNADQALLKQLSGTTGGIFHKAEEADGLERIFLRMFENVSQADTVPLEGNKFTIDSSIEEATILVFKNDEKPTQFKTPSGQVFDKSNHPENVTWHEENNYDLVTLKTPISGTWEILAKMDPDNRVMVVTNLQIRHSDVPKVAYKTPEFNFLLALAQDGEIISRPAFLRFVSIDTSYSDTPVTQVLNDNGENGDDVAGDGIFAANIQLANNLPKGTYQFNVLVDGTTFKREFHQDVRLFTSSGEAVVELEDTTATLKLFPELELVDPHSVTAIALIWDTAAEETRVPMTRLDEQTWHLDISEYQPLETFTFSVAMQGKLWNGEALIDEIAAKMPGQPTPVTPPPTPVEAPPADEPSAEGETEEEAPPATEDEAAEPEETVEGAETKKKAFIAAILVTANLLLFGVGWVVYKKFFGGSGDNPADELEEDENNAAEQVAEASDEEDFEEEDEEVLEEVS